MLSESLLEEIIKIAKKYNVEKLILFGSRARGDYKRASDIDLAVSGGDFSAFAIDVEEDTSTLLKFDIINLNSNVKQELLDSIQREGVVLYEKV